MSLNNKYNPLLKRGIQKINNPDLEKYDVTVGTDGDYPAIDGIRLALEDGKEHLKLISDVTETTTFLLSSNLFINGQNKYKLTLAKEVSINASSNIFQLDDLTFEGDVTDDFVIQSGIIRINNCEIIYKSARTTSSSYLFYTPRPNSFIKNSKITITNGGSITRIDMRFSYENIDLYSTGSDVRIVLGGISNNVTFKNMRFYGNLYHALSSSGGCIYHNPLHQFYCPDDINLNLYNENVNVIIPKGFVVSNMNFSLRLFEIKYFRMCNHSRFEKGTVLNAELCNWTSGGGVHDNVFEQVTFTGNITISGDNNSFKNCIFENDVTIDADNVTIENSFVENGTITVNPTADKTTLIGNRTLTSIGYVGSTNTQLVANNLI